MADSAPDGRGTLTIDHEVPFQRSATGIFSISVPEVAYPTAVQLLSLGQEMPFKAVLVLPAALGLDWTAHDVPFQNSIKVDVPLKPGVSPTAKHAVALGHETPLNALCPLGTTGEDNAQLLPFHRAARTVSVPKQLTHLVWLFPTAMQLLVPDGSQSMSYK
jgi:hypothetical protein